MRGITVLLILFVICVAVYFLVPTEGLRSRAKGLIQEVQQGSPPPEIGDITSSFGALFGAQDDGTEYETGVDADAVAEGAADSSVGADDAADGEVRGSVDGEATGDVADTVQQEGAAASDL